MYTWQEINVSALLSLIKRMVEEKNREIVYSTLKELSSIHHVGTKSYYNVTKIEKEIREKYNLKMSEKTIKSCLEELEEAGKILCYYDPKDGSLISAIIVTRR